MANFYASYPAGSSGGGGGTVNSVTASLPLSSSGGTNPNISISLAGSTTDGYLSSADWNTFNSKQAALTIGNLTDVGTDGITITGGTGSVIGTGTSIAQHVADSTHNGYLSSVDWATFNAKQAALTIGDLTDTGTDGITVTSGAGAVIGAGTTIAQHVADASHNGYLSSADWISFNGKGTGTVTSVALSDGSGTAIYSISGSPITGSGTLTFSLISQNANLVFAGPSSGGATAPMFRSLVSSDIPSLSAIYLPLAGGTMSGAIDMGSHKVTSVTDPTAAQDAATKAYVDASVAALNPAAACYAATTANIPGTYLNGVAGVGATFTTTATGSLSIDGVTPPLSSRVLIKNQATGLQNGIYTITTLGSVGVSTVFTRALDYDTASDMNSAGLIPIINGTVNALSSWQQVAMITTVGTDSLVFTEFTANPSLYLLKANNLSDVASKTTSFDNVSPTTTKGDTIVNNGTNNVRQAVGTDGFVLTADSAQTTGIKWAAPVSASFNYWSGYTDGNATWTTTNTSLVDPTNSGGNALTTRFSSGLIVIAGAANIAGVNLTPASTSDIFMVSAAFSGGGESSGAQAAFELIDSNGNVVTTASSEASATDNYYQHTLVGIWVPNTTSAVDLKLKAAAIGGGTTRIQNAVSALVPTIEWSIMQIG